MAAFSQMQHGYFRTPSSLSIDTRSSRYFDDDECSILDGNILDPAALDHALDMSPINASRRDSLFGESSAIFSPKGEWDYGEHDMGVPDRLTTPSTFPSYASNNPFRTAAYSQHQNPTPWHPESDSGSCTPTAIYDGFSRDMDHQHQGLSLFRPATVGPSTYGISTAAIHRPLSAFPSAPSNDLSIPPSPHPARDWMPSEHTEPRSISKRMRPASPALRPSSPLMRRDGIRKKNARFEIPAERNLLNIDQLIAQSSDDQEIKELKQQKRLLRNRQAALDSRQRKKQHTERLEDEKKQFTTIISELEERLAQLELRETEWAQREEEWNSTQQRYEQYIDTCRLDKEEMIRSHTIESGNLRRKNTILIQQIQKMEHSGISAPSGPSPFGLAYSEAENNVIESSTWSDFSLLNDFPMESNAALSTTLVPNKKEKTALSNDVKPAASGLLLILLLCGAFVASKSSTGSTPTIPRMPDDIRAASATVLDNIFKDAGVQQTDPRLSLVNRVETLESSNPESAWPTSTPSLTAAEMIGLSGSSLDVLNHQLVAPSEEQEQEQLFSLSADQYNSHTSHDFLHESEPSTSQGRRHLGASLAAMRSTSGSSVAEVYTRSLMWDKVPAEVVRDFAKLVSEYNSAGVAQQHGGTIG
ncbi:MAG: hypothetical protein M1829_002432 [Trizodia sp. TS-e1964]|nr:MAG: hypothetical protein M1829_002432 [Trizodia sp. TS-e1964]